MVWPFEKITIGLPKNNDLRDNKTLSIVLCSEGYPETFQNKKEIKNLDKIVLKEDQFIFHAGTNFENSIIFSNGGRVLNFVAKSNSFKKVEKLF